METAPTIAGVHLMALSLPSAVAVVQVLGV